MFLFHKDGVWDLDLDFLEELLALIDGQLEALDAEAKESSDPDGSGIWDRREGVVGLGFVACQQYLHATYPHLQVKDKLMALQSGPKHARGVYVVELINAAANFWKHHDEWRSNDKHAGRTKIVIEQLGVSAGKSYVLSNVLYRMVQPEPDRFRSVVPLLISWRDQLIGPREQPSSKDE
jgi:hypothetical protein